MIGIEGFRSKAARTGKLSGISRGAIRDAEGRLTGAWCEVHRKDWEKPAREEVPLCEYATGKNNWAKMPETMIKKVAEAACLRMAFADDLGGVYIEEEFDRKAEASQNEPPQIPSMTQIGKEQTDFTVIDEYTIPYGVLKHHSIERAHSTPEKTQKLNDFLSEIIAKADRLKKPIPIWAKELIERVEAFRMSPEDDIPGFDE